MGLRQKRFNNEEVPTIINSNEHHMACLFLLDNSGSMAGEPIKELNDGINRFKLEVCEDKTTRDILDVAIVSFNTTVNVEQEFVPVEHMEPISLEATGGTNMEEAVRVALDMVNERVDFYKNTTETVPYKPWIVMISDGGANVDGIAPEVSALAEKGKLAFWSLGVDGYYSEILHQLSGKRVLKLKGYDFSGFFNWLSKSMRSISQSSLGETPKGVLLPDNVDKDVSDMM